MSAASRPGDLDFLEGDPAPRAPSFLEARAKLTSGGSR